MSRSATPIWSRSPTSKSREWSARSATYAAPTWTFLPPPSPNAPVNHLDDPFVVEGEIEASLAAAFGGSALDDMQQRSIIGASYNPEDRLARHEFARRCLADLLSRDDRSRAVFELVIHSVFVTRTNRTSNGYQSHGGSASGAIERDLVVDAARPFRG